MDNKIKENQDMQDRILFYKFHNLQDVITVGIYIFTDLISLKYSKITIHNNFELLDIRNLPIQIRAEKYKLWHQMVSTILFGIPNDNAICKKCLFFIKKFNTHISKCTASNSSSNNNDDSDSTMFLTEMHDLTDNIKLEMYICDLAVLTTSTKYIIPSIPILDMNTRHNLDIIESIKNIVRCSYEIKIILTKQDENELNTINKIMNEDNININQKYITMSQMLGHYLNHIITSSYLEVDYGYALTVHKSQGSTYDNVFVEYNNLLANKKDTEKDKLLYTAITRSANKLHIFY